MTQKLSKKGRNPGAVDNWLEALGYYRKNVAYDETCLFRAVSEQLFNIQIYHERIRSECVNHAKKNLSILSKFMKADEDIIEHIEKLEKHMVICGNIEIELISRAYKCNVTVFDGTTQLVNQMINDEHSETILLCLMNEDHYDAVYHLEHIVTAGFCQAIIYKILYQNVFEIPKVDDIVHGMLYDKTYITTQSEILLENKGQDYEDTESESTQIESKENTPSVQLNIAPFPFKVAKALDASIYRNIEYDSWTEVRREMRLGEWYYGDDKLILGTRCLLNEGSNKEPYECYIQDIIKNENRCVVYITKLAQKRIVNYNDLSPECDAKPWPLPYRFSRNLNISNTTTILCLDKIKSHRRKKDKTQIKSENSCSNNHTSTDSTSEHNLTAYVGAPLHMQSSPTSQEEQSDVTNDANHEVTTQDAHCNTSPRYQWEQPYYSYPTMLTPILPDSYSWPPTPVSAGVFNYNIRPVITPVVTNSNVMHYCDVNPQTTIYNYPMEQYSYPYQPWAQMTESQPTTSTSQHTQLLVDHNHNNKEQGTNQKTSQPINETSTQYVNYQDSVPENIPPIEQPVICSPTPRINPQINVYSPIMPVPPGTPVIYSPSTEILVPTTPVHMYSSSIELPYIGPEHYTYPPTPTTGWYPVGVNAQGFVFPTPNVQTVAKP